MVSGYFYFICDKQFLLLFVYRSYKRSSLLLFGIETNMQQCTWIIDDDTWIGLIYCSAITTLNKYLVTITSNTIGITLTL